MKTLPKPRKCIHIKLNMDTHAALRVECFKKNVSIQEFFEEIATKFAEGHEGFQKIADRIVRRRTAQKIKDIANKADKVQAPTSHEINTIEALYDMISEVSPIVGPNKEEADDSNVVWDDEEVF